MAFWNNYKVANEICSQYGKLIGTSKNGISVYKKIVQGVIPKGHQGAGQPYTQEIISSFRTGAKEPFKVVDRNIYSNNEILTNVINMDTGAGNRISHGISNSYGKKYNTLCNVKTNNGEIQEIIGVNSGNGFSTIVRERDFRPGNGYGDLKVNKHLRNGKPEYLKISAYGYMMPNGTKVNGTWAKKLNSDGKWELDRHTCGWFCNNPRTYIYQNDKGKNVVERLADPVFSYARVPKYIVGPNGKLVKTNEMVPRKHPLTPPINF